MTAVDERVTQVRQAIQAAQQGRARAQAEADSASAAYQSELVRLKNDFGLETIEEAAEAIKKLDVEIEAEVTRLTEELRRLSDN